MLQTSAISKRTGLHVSVEAICGSAPLRFVKDRRTTPRFLRLRKAGPPDSSREIRRLPWPFLVLAQSEFPFFIRSETIFFHVPRQHRVGEFICGGEFRPGVPRFY